MQPPDVVPSTKRWLLDSVTFRVETALGVAIRGHFGNVAGLYEVGPDGGVIELTVDATSIDTGSGIWDGLLRSADNGALAEHPQVRFVSTNIREVGTGRLRVEGTLEAVAKVEPVAFDATLIEIDGGLRLEAVSTVDRERLGQSADRFALLLPATLHVTLHLVPP